MRKEENASGHWMIVCGIFLAFAGGLGLLLLKVAEDMSLKTGTFFHGFSISAVIIGTLMILYPIFHTRDAHDRRGE